MLGNHDQWDGKKTELRLVSELEKVGIQVLRNSSKKIARGLSSLYVAGTDDYWVSCDLEKALRRVPQNEFKILLCHNPDVRKGIKNGTKIDITLAATRMAGRWQFRSSRTTLFRSKSLMDTPMSTAGSGRLCFTFGSGLRQRLPVLHYKNMTLCKKTGKKILFLTWEWLSSHEKKLR